MSERPLSIRPFQTANETAIVSPWQLCELTFPWNNPYKDIAKIESSTRIIFGRYTGKLFNRIRNGRI